MLSFLAIRVMPSSLLVSALLGLDPEALQSFGH